MKPASPQVGVSLPTAVIDRIDDLAGREGLSRSSYLRRLVLRGLDQPEHTDRREVPA